MEKRSSLTWKTMVLAALAGAGIGIGVGLILTAGMGSDTVTVFQDGLHQQLRISYGQASRLYNLILILTAFIAARKYFGAGTVISALITGFAIDGTVALTGRFIVGFNLPGSILVFLAGQTLYAFSLAMLIRCKLGMNGLDSLIYALQEKSGISYRRLRWGVDFLLTWMGWLLGGIFGIGTLISILTTGPLIDRFQQQRRVT
ncbi:YczE/YyaS/YitT family protein [Holdemania massiliensis]|uniref:YitT family protein n=1 Tax=Holdemania massiliensis TaxID=1468449 RepID=A0A6N7S6V9_9FIRM|nr:hypothetical protein [Holdemania massiliensis]MSA71029.1 hypothetical protein [Holdemania massiliensis]MSA89355.1 hypothetical protein [Holdemania massiliensis]MSB78108.1 hypothetical protein [Holdemania massiliensis]MSC33033.1 hypothetical protein [Holdemania massiliensis]MSC39657.1 hypothetical protein [Holdemania massiliensis]